MNRDRVCDVQEQVVLVRQVTWEADGVISLRLVDPDGADLEPWQPGAHVDVVLPSGLVRQYSLCGDIDDHGSYRLAVLLERESRGGSREIHETALTGRRIVIRGPRNHFQLIGADRFVFIAGGIGVTPIVPMLQEVERRRRPWRLVYAGRSRSSMAFLGELRRYAADKVEIVTEDEQGFPAVETILREVCAGTAIYCCGPPGLISAVETHSAKHFEPGVVHVERFTATDDPSATLSGFNSTPFEVQLARSRVTLIVPADASILQAVRSVKPSLLFSCKQGYCGTCEVRVLDGVPDHRDTVLTDEERANGKMMICVGRSKGPRLVLDL